MSAQVGKPDVVVNNSIMKRLDNGKLIRHNPMESSFAKPSLIVRGGTLTASDKNALPKALFDTTKNALGGSQVARSI